MKFTDYLESLINESITTNEKVIDDFILPTLKNKGTFWVPLRRKYTAPLLPKRLLAFHQLGHQHLNKFLNINKNISISTFTNTDSIKNLLYQRIGRGSGLLALVEGRPISISPKDNKSRKEENRRWINFDKNISLSSYESIKKDVVQKVNDYLTNKDLNSFSVKEKNGLIAFYHKTVWNALKEKNPKNPDFYKHLSFKSPIRDMLFSKPLYFKGNRSNNMSYNETIMDRIKIIKIYYTEDSEKYIDKNNPIFIPFSNEKFEKDLKNISNQ